MRSLGQISLKPYMPSRDERFASVLMKRFQNVCLDVISVKFGCELYEVKLGHYVRFH